MPIFSSFEDTIKKNKPSPFFAFYQIYQIVNRQRHHFELGRSKWKRTLIFNQASIPMPQTEQLAKDDLSFPLPEKTEMRLKVDNVLQSSKYLVLFL